ncbi:class I SAM-dependent methyltransferase [Actinoplanes sp. NPDC051494]|uniref:class I SAM-dependent methyltransferase n=1 Tax=Actinoplanes sp. NPDC051494 TaxID=3363907 RepID=UPI0037B54CAA
MSDYLDVNRANWDERAPAHAASAEYNFAAFAADPEHLSDVVTFDRPLLGDIRGLRGVHLQCHIGTDTVSLSRLGATMTGLDFSAASLTEARRLATLAGADIDFVESDLYGAPDVLEPGSFDLVFTGIGAIGWLPDIRRWAQVVATLLKPGGRLFIREGHPMLWAVDDEREDDLLVLDFDYFEHKDPLVWEQGGTYVETEHQFVNKVTHSWNHGMGEIVTALLDAGMTIAGLTEHDSAPWEALPGKMTKVPPYDEWRLTDRPNRLPHTYTLRAVRNPV